MHRRRFLHQGSKYSIGFLGLHMFASGCDQPAKQTAQAKDLQLITEHLDPGYGPLLPDPEGILNLPEGFSYRIISRKGDLMTDGFLVPGRGDGMAAFAGPDGKVIVIRNHEVSPGDKEQGPFGENLELLSKLDATSLYDYGRGNLPCLGGTSTFVYDPASGEIETEYLSLIGTIRNCAGGLTPWNSWISCEENTSIANSKLEKNHGYNFEVKASATPLLEIPQPIKEMGRFNHEAVCVDPRTHIVYQTEDRGDGLIYRYLPNAKGNLLAGGKLQVLAIKGKPSFDTRNWAELKSEKMEIGKKYDVVWMDIDGVDSEEDDLRYRGSKKGGATFARGEGMWFGQDELFFACTNGGHLEHGQIFKYTPSPKEGQVDEQDQPGILEIFVEPNNIDLVKSCDNLTIANHGDLVICEDRTTPRIVGITPQGSIYHIADNVGFESEFAGAAFSPDGQTLFVNIQGPGLTLAIEGPWSKKAELG